MTAQRSRRRASCIAIVFFPEAGGPVKMKAFFRFLPLIRFFENLYVSPTAVSQKIEPSSSAFLKAASSRSDEAIREHPGE